MSARRTVIDALRALLNNQDEPSPRLSEDDVYRPQEDIPAGAIEFHYIFHGLTPDDEADFLSALVPNTQGELEAHIHVRYSDPDTSRKTPSQTME
jgi:putative ATP-dependent endonuclease of OLD family